MLPQQGDIVLYNGHLLGIFIAGTLIGGVVLLGFMYYFYVRKSSVIFLMSAYFLGMFLRLFFQAFLIVGEIQGVIFPLTSDHFEWGMFVSSIYSVLLMTTLCVYFSRIRLMMMQGFGGYLILILAVLSWYMKGYMNMLFIYTLLIAGISLVFILYDTIVHRLFAMNRIIPILVLTFLVTTTNIARRMGSEIQFDWLAVVILVFGTIAYLFISYRQVYEGKESLYKLLIYDDDFGCFSKNYLIEQFDETDQGVIIFVDLNKFKWVNDSFGHQKGDSLLKSFTTRAGKRMNDHRILSRFGGDEFMILCKDENLISARLLCENLIKDFREALLEENLPVSGPGLGISVGLSAFKESEGNEALQLADVAMYQSKMKGNNTITQM